jgi:hypothetical protein
MTVTVAMVVVFSLYECQPNFRTRTLGAEIVDSR